jgi:TetR/AcrR family transcriptional regulator, transcriptional repressor for nem operon
MREECQTKLRIVQAAFDLFLTNSYGSVGVEEICKRAGVGKGSFYHFFRSKSEVGAAALEEYWRSFRQPQLDTVFSVQRPPLDRLSGYCEQLYENQESRFQQWKKVLGCPATVIGSELSMKEERVRIKSDEIADRTCRYLEAALRDAKREGLAEIPDVRARAREVYAFVTGVLLQARIGNNLDLVKTIRPGMFRMLGLEEKIAA